MKILVYDIETTLNLIHTFHLGKQVLRHTQLLKGYFSRTHIICIGYQWLSKDSLNNTTTSPAKILTWGKSLDDERKMIEEFDQQVKKADIVLGKNNTMFDDKHINIQRLWHGLDGTPEWVKCTEDLERQMRRHFKLQSFSLDYFSEQLGYGGKKKMTFEHWVEIGANRIVQLLNLKTKESSKLISLLYNKSLEEVVTQGTKAEKEMFTYCKKDVADTGSIWLAAEKHFNPKWQISSRDNGSCIQCGSKEIVLNKTSVVFSGQFHSYFCNAHKGYAGRRAVLASGKLGKLRK